MRNQRRVWGGLLVAWATSFAAAQDPIAGLKNKGALDDNDRATLRQWIERQVTLVLADEPQSASTAVLTLRTEFDGSTGYKEAFATEAARLVNDRLATAKDRPAAQLITFLSTLNAIETHTTLVAAMRDSRAAVRAAAAVGLRTLRAKIAAAPGDAVGQTLRALRDAGKSETSPATLKLIYLALNYAGVNADQKGPAVALVELLEQRAREYTASGSPRCQNADAEGLKIATMARGQLDDDQKKRLARAAASMLKHSVETYSAEKLNEMRDKTATVAAIDRRNDIELLIETAETTLREVLDVKEGPDITTAMRDGSAVAMRRQLVDWSEQKLEGALGQRYRPDEGEAAPAQP
ncbi:MAG: hypothetical protein KDA32_09970 [Phycisphaerales bacterium]|nr:hypothetical protein [Phycisphaerales bacterium]